MKNIDRLVNGIQNDNEHYDRRKFLTQTGRGLVAATILGETAGNANAQGQHHQDPVTGPDKNIHAGSDGKPIELKDLKADTEIKDDSLFTPNNPHKRIGYAIVGLGSLSLQQILPAFGNCKDSRPVALVSGSREKALKVAHQYGIAEKNIYSYDDFDDIRHNDEIDVVYIVLPNSMHEEFTIRAAKAGKHVLCEKPMTTSSAAAQRMIDACKKAGRRLMIAYRIQYEPNNNQIKKWVRNQEYGKIKIIEATNTQNQGDPDQWRHKIKLSGGGPLPDVGIYCLNTIRFLLGTEPSSVYASNYTTPGDPRFKEIDETVMFQLHFPDGTQANCTTSYGVHQCRRYRCFTDKGAWLGMEPAFDYSGLKMELSQAKDKMEWKQEPKMAEKKQFALEMDHMSDCVRHNKQPFTPGEEGLQDMRIMEAIVRSIKEKRVIELDAINGSDIFRGTPPKEDA